MSTIFHLDDSEQLYTDDLDLDELYEKRKDEDLRKLKIYNKILHKIHTKIKQTSRLCKNEPYCWYQVPTLLFGVPEYSFTVCLQYIVDKLQNNGFLVQVMKPNLLLISWKDWIPTHVRDEIQSQLGKKIDGYGQIIDDGKKEDVTLPQDKYTPIKDTKPMQNSIYKSKTIMKMDKINDT